MLQVRQLDLRRSEVLADQKTFFFSPCLSKVVCVVHNFKGTLLSNEALEKDTLSSAPTTSLPRVESPLQKYIASQVLLNAPSLCGRVSRVLTVIDVMNMPFRWQNLGKRRQSPLPHSNHASSGSLAGSRG